MDGSKLLAIGIVFFVCFTGFFWIDAHFCSLFWVFLKIVTGCWKAGLFLRFALDHDGLRTWLLTFSSRWLKVLQPKKFSYWNSACVVLVLLLLVQVSVSPRIIVTALLLIAFHLPSLPGAPGCRTSWLWYLSTKLLASGQAWEVCTSVPFGSFPYRRLAKCQLFIPKSGYSS